MSSRWGFSPIHDEPTHAEIARAPSAELAPLALQALGPGRGRVCLVCLRAACAGVAWLRPVWAGLQPPRVGIRECCDAVGAATPSRTASHSDPAPAPSSPRERAAGTGEPWDSRAAGGTWGGLHLQLGHCTWPHLSQCLCSLQCPSGLTSCPTPCMGLLGHVCSLPGVEG